MRTLSRYWRMLSHLGTNSQMTYIEVKRLHLVNLIALASAPSMLFFSIVNCFEDRYFLALINLANSLFCVFVLFLQHKKFYELAKFILLGMSFCFFYFGALFYGNAGENYLLCIMIVSMLLYDNKRIQWFVGLMVILAIVSIKLFPEELFVTEHVPRSRVIINTVSSLVFIAISVHFFKKIILNNMMKIEEQRKNLQLLNDEKEQIISIVAHDVRIPLSTLENMMYLLRQQVIDGKVSETYILQLQRQIAQQKEALDDILYWSSRSMRGVPDVGGKTSLVEVVDAIMSIFQSACHAKGIHLRAQIDKSFELCVNSDHLMIILRNMVSNAVKFSHTNSFIDISASKDSSHGFIHVKDYGIGMGKDQADDLFHHIQQRSEGTDREPGAGLGLLLCSELIKQNKGIIKVESVRGEGSTFSVGFPKVFQN